MYGNDIANAYQSKGSSDMSVKHVIVKNTQYNQLGSLSN